MMLDSGKSMTPTGPLVVEVAHHVTSALTLDAPRKYGDGEATHGNSGQPVADVDAAARLRKISSLKLKIVSEPEDGTLTDSNTMY